MNILTIATETDPAEASVPTLIVALGPHEFYFWFEGFKPHASYFKWSDHG